MRHTFLFSTLLSVVLAASVNAQAFSASGTGGAIPDNNAAGFTSTITLSGLLPDVGSIDSVVITDLAHTWVGDVIVRVRHVASGTTVMLFQRPRGDGGTLFGDSSNLGGTYTFVPGMGHPTIETAAMAGGDAFVIPSGNYQPAGQTSPSSTAVGVNSVHSNYSSFVGLSANGDWQLIISDHASGDLGSFGGWTLNGSAVPEPASMIALGAGLAGLALRRRKK